MDDVSSTPQLMEKLMEMNVTNNKTLSVWVPYPSVEVQITLYSIILLLSVVGNFLVIVTLVQNKRMRTVTNVFLLNLAISDLLLGIFCMPFTLTGSLLRKFIFGEFMCKALPYFQGKDLFLLVKFVLVICASLN
uniref:G-protein coupled receptors family 1 profile domain-containing protein n=1 Tax=Strigamia maritima TaxID=126957 RepID=T1JFW0_STRMM